jgi:hypothetical protein
MTTHNPVFGIRRKDGYVPSADEIPADPALPQLATMLDGGSMSQVLQESLAEGHSEGRLEIERCRIAYVRYMPLEQCIVGYELDIADSSTGRRGRQLVCGTVFAEDRSERYVAVRAKQLRAQPRFGPPFAHLRDGGILLTAFPNDLKIRRLHRLVEPTKLKRILQAAMDMTTAKLASARDGAPAIDILSYKPLRSCLVRCVVRFPKDHGEVVYGRMYHNERGAKIYQGMRALWQGEARRRGGLSVAKPLGYDPGTNVLLQGSVGEKRLMDLAGDENFIDRVGLVGRGLAGIHSNPGRIERFRDTIQDLATLETRVRDFARINSELGRKCMDVVERLRSALPDALEQDLGLIHGDFFLKQLVIEAEHTSIIDFDRIAMGDGYIDLGTLLANLKRFETKGSVERSIAWRAADKFCSEYETARQATLARDRLNWFQALALFTSALSALKYLRPGWRTRMDRSLDLADAMLGA